jgi:hypothetical protein
VNSKHTPSNLVERSDVHRSADAAILSKWDLFERVSKTLSIIAVPVVVAIVGWYLQDILSKRTVSQEYVSLAVSILKERDADPGLRSWAVDLLNANASTQFSPEVSERLRSGSLRLPVSVSLQRAMAELDVEQILNEMFNKMGVVRKFALVANQQIPSISASVVDGEEALTYNRDFILALNRASGTNWAAVEALAHETGHLVLGHLRSPSNATSRKQHELDADLFAGGVLRRLGATLDEALAGPREMPEPDVDDFRPPRLERIAAVRDGWLRADADQRSAPSTPHP